jgi:hypothetical protein
MLWSKINGTIKYLGLPFLAIFPAYAQAADLKCVQAKVVSGDGCKSLKVEFDFTQCEGQNSITYAKISRCAGTHATATVSTPNGTYSASLKAEEGIWNQLNWTVGKVIRLDNLSVSQVARPREARRVASVPLSVESSSLVPSSSPDPSSVPLSALSLPPSLPPTPVTQYATPIAQVTAPIPLPVPPPQTTPYVGVPAIAVPLPPAPPNAVATPEPPVRLFGPLVLLDKGQWKVTMSGFVELDMISDSTRSLGETVGNAPIDKPNTLAGANGRTQFSVRDTRLAFTIEPPSLGSWKFKAHYESDFAGFDPNSTGATASLNSEASFFNNPTYRLRHAYFQATHEGFQILVGQSWSVFAWQPYYFFSSDEVYAIPGMTANRTAQVRLMEQLDLGHTFGLQGAFAVLRPAQRDSLYPDLQAGLRFTFGNRSSGLTGGPSGPIRTQPMSLGISGLAREINIPAAGGGVGDTSNFLASAYALDFMLPIVASSDGKDVGNTLSLIGEYTSGRGYGDQFPNWTGNTANPLNASAVSPSKAVNLDGGIGDYDATGTFGLIDLTSYNIHLQYHFPTEWKTFSEIGYGDLSSSNMSIFTPKSGLTSAGKQPYNRDTVVFGNLFHQFSEQIRVGIEFAHVETTYADGAVVPNNRYQITALFIF